MGLLDQLFNPWQLGAPGNGLFGGVAPEMTQEDVAALIAASPRSRHAPGFLKGLSYREPNGDPNAGQNYANDPLPQGLPPMPLAPATVSLDPFQNTLQRAPGIPTAPLVEPGRSSAEPSAVWGPSMAAEPRIASNGLASPIMPLSPGIRPDQFADGMFGNRQQAPIDEASVPLPRPRPVMTAGDDALPPNATPTVGPGPLPAPPPPAAQPSRAPASEAAPAPAPVMQPAAPSFGQKISEAMTNIGAILSPDVRERQIQNQTYQALVRSGKVPPDVAMAAVSNPELLKQIIPQVFGPKQSKFTQVGEDMMGNKEWGYADEVNKKTYDRSGREIASAPNAAGGDGGNFLAKGVAGVNHELVGDEYLNQYSPEVQAAVKNYVGGESMPTGNPRKGFTQAIKMISQKYGNDIGLPASDTEFGARRTMRNDLAKTTPGSMGGQITSGRTAINHLEKLAEAAKSLDNFDLGVTWFSKPVNELRALGTEQAAKIAKLQAEAQHYGQEITKFYAGSPGGEAERTRFLTSLAGAKTPKELAAVLEGEKELIPGRLNEIENRIAGALGPAASKYPVHSAESKAALVKIDEAISHMKGVPAAASTSAAPQTAAAAQPAAAAPKAAPVKTFEEALRLPKGTRFTDPNGVERIR